MAVNSRPIIMVSPQAFPRPWTEKTYFVRDLLFSSSDLTSFAEQKYLDTRWSLIDQLLSTTSVGEFKLMFEIMGCSIEFQWADYFAVLVGFAVCSYRGPIFDRAVALELIDKTELLDAVLKMPKTIRALLTIRAPRDEGQSNDVRAASTTRQFIATILAHAFIKFPDLMKLQCNYTKARNGRPRRCKFTAEDIKRWF